MTDLTETFARAVQNANAFEVVVNSDQTSAITPSGRSILTLAEFQRRANQALQSNGLIYPPIDYVDGLEVASSQQTYRFDGVVYNWLGATPFTTTGNFADEPDWNIVQDLAPPYRQNIDGQVLTDQSGIITVPQYEVNSDSYFVFKNGSLLISGDDYAESSTTTITINQSWLNTDIFSIVGRNFSGVSEVLSIDAANVIYRGLPLGGLLEQYDQKFEDIDESLVEIKNDIEDIETRLGSSTWSPEFQVTGGMTSWWSAPSFLRSERYSYIPNSNGQGHLMLSVIDNETGEVINHTVDTKNFSADDHNTGCAIADGRNVLIMYPGRTNANDFNRFYYWNGQEGESPPLNGLESINFARDYPVGYNIGNEFLAFGRTSSNADEPQYVMRLQKWPLIAWGPRISMFESTKTWPYIASRRSDLDRNRINIAVGWHPDNEPHASVYTGYITRAGGNGDWVLRTTNGDSQVCNLSTGVGLPFDENDLELAYNAAPGESTRLLHVGDNCFVIASFTAGGDGSDGVYKYVYKNSGVWKSVKIADTGKPFNASEGVRYFGGAAMSPAGDVVYLTRQYADGLWRYEEHTTSDGGATFDITSSFDSRGADGCSIVLGRPLVEQYSYDSFVSLPDNQWRVVLFAGRVNPISYNDWNTDLVTSEYLQSTWNREPDQMNGSVVASEGCLATGHRSATVASRASFARARVSGAFAASTSELLGVETASVASAGVAINGNQVAALASNNINSTPTAKNTAAISSEQIDIAGEQATAISSQFCQVGSKRSTVISASYCSTAHNRTAVFGRAIATADDDTVVGGYELSTTPATANRKWELNNTTGNLRLAGTVSSNQTFADIAKMFVNGEGVEIPVGSIVSMYGDKVFKSSEKDKVFGVIAATPAMIHNDTPFHWQGRYLTDDFGRQIKQQAQMVRWKSIEDDDGNVIREPYDGLAKYVNPPVDSEFYTALAPVENPEYTPNRTQVPRSQRPDEWSCVGVHGILRVRINGSITQQMVDNSVDERSHLYVKPVGGGIGGLSESPTPLKLMRVEIEKAGREYGVAVCYLGEYL